MTRNWTLAGTLALALLVCATVPGTWAQERPAYTPAEYNAYTACANDKVAQSRAKCLDDFTSKFPQSTLLPFAYRLQYLTFYEMRDYVQTVEHVDILLAVGDKLEFTSRLEALVARAQAFYLGSSQRALLTPEQLTKAREASLAGLKMLDEWKKPETMADDLYTQQKRGFTILFHSIAGIASLQLKDYRASAESLQAALAIEPNDALNYYRLGIAYVQQDPPRYDDGLYALARAIALKVPDEGRVRNYLRSQLIKYQGGTVCDAETDRQVADILTQATASPTRPETLRIPGQAELTKAREGAATFLQTLQAGGEQAKVTWTAMCGLEFPEVLGKVLEVTQGNESVLLKLYLGTSTEDTEAGTTPNMEVKVVGQPAARLLKKDDAIRFSGTLAQYVADPFLVSWENAKVNPEDLPEDKPQPPKKAPAKRPAKRPAKSPTP